MDKNTIDLKAVTQAVRRALEGERAGLNEADTLQHAHGDRMLDLWQVVDRTVQEQPDGTLLAAALQAASMALDVQAADPLWGEYQRALGGLAGKIQDGTLSEQALIDLAARLEQGSPPGSAGGLTRLGGMFTQLARSVGGEKRLSELAGQLGVTDLFANGLGLLGGTGQSGRDTGIRFLVSQSRLGRDPLTAKSTAIVLRETLVEINRQQTRSS